MLNLSICFILTVFLSEDYSNYASAGKISIVNFFKYFFEFLWFENRVYNYYITINFYRSLKKTVRLRRENKH